jgi:putative sterol carrier protein
MKNEQWLNEKLSNFKSFIQSNLQPIEEQSDDTKKNVEYVMSMSLDDWLSFASKHLMKFKNNPQRSTGCDG